MKTNEKGQAFIDDVKAKLCAEIIRKPDFSLGQIAELAHALGCNVDVSMAKPE